MINLQSRVWFWGSLIALLGFVDFSNHSVSYAEVAKEPPPIHPEAVLSICPGMPVSEVVRLIGPPRMDDCKEAIPLFPFQGGLLKKQEGFALGHWTHRRDRPSQYPHKASDPGVAQSQKIVCDLAISYFGILGVNRVPDSLGLR